MGMDATLDEALSNLEVDGRYSCIETLKESASETTQLVASPEGVRYIRKYLTGENLGDGYRALASIQSLHLPRVVARYDLSDTKVVILTYKEGLALRDYVKERGPLAAEQAIGLACDVAHALIALHTRGPSPVVHRDVTPSNVIVSTWGRASLIDLGIAREVKMGVHHDTQILGTQGYAAPEQLGFAQSDERTDVYALGPLLYFMLTGEDPRQDIRDRLLVDVRVSDGLRTVIRRCTEYEPSRRYQSAEEFLVALDSPQLSQPQPGEISARAFATSKPAPSSSPPAVLPVSKPSAGHPILSRGVRGLIHRVFSIGGAIVCVPFCIVGLMMPWMGNASPTTGDLIVNIISDWSVVFLLFAPSYLLLCNPFDWMSKVRLYRRKRLRRVLLTFAICFAALFLLIGISSQFYSPQHLAVSSSR